MTPESDARLVDRAREGDGAAFEQLVGRHLAGAHAVALAELSDERDAEDAVQDAFITALERLEDCRDGASFGPWLRQIVRNRSRTLRRREQVRATDPLEHAQAAAATANPARDFERTQLRRRLTDALAALTDIQRTVLLMHDLEGYRHREIAVELDMPEGTVRSHLFHGRRALRSLLGEAPQPEQMDG